MSQIDHDFSKPVPIAENIYWIGIYLENDPFQCHPYFIKNGNQSILIDPGSMIQKEKIIEKIRSVCDMQDINYIILHHQDPDLCAAVPEIERLIHRDDLKIVTHSRMAVLIKHYGIHASYYNIDENEFQLNAGNLLLKFYTTPYLHSPGAFVTYVPQKKVLFSGDLFGGLEENWQFYADENYFQQIEGFHMSYMPSRDILNYGLRKIESLDIKLIAPQHGSIIKEQYISDLLAKMKSMDCGLYIESKYSENLTDTIDKLNMTTKELEISFDTVHKLKTKQDGDYFLTTLLLQPLMKNYNKSKNVTTKFIIYQFKNFIFKDRKEQIGGDICITGNLIFKNQTYTMFFNGDSMGKSIQGSGGALVMGTALNSIMHRSASDDKVLKMLPDEWLTNTYEELQSIFLAFDGAMMVSGIMGLINDSTGELSYFNAEHPYPVIYRNSNATFLQKQFHLRKFGSPMEMDFSILKAQLQAEDIIILGSDGRDDLNLTPGQKYATMNEDDTLFLNTVMQAHGSLEFIVKNIFRHGDITDDLSLMRIGYHEKKPVYDYKQCQTLFDQIHAERIKANLKFSNFNKVIELIELLPEKERFRFSYIHAYSLYNLKRYNLAIDLLNNILKKSTAHFSTHRLLGYAYYQQQDYLKCREHWQQAIQINNNEKLKKMLARLENRIAKQEELLGTKQGQV